MKKCLSIVFNPFTNDSRVLKECKSLLKNGYDVSVIAMHEGDLPETDIVENIPVRRIRLRTRKWSKQLIIQLIKYMELALKIVIRFRNIDIIHCNDLAPLPISVFIKFLSFNRIKIIYDAHELQTEQEHNPNTVMHFLMVVTENLFINFADKTITVSKGIAEEYAKRYKISTPALVLNCPHYQSVPKKNKFREVFNIRKDQTIFLYQGGLNKQRGIELILQTFKKLNRKDAVLVLMGYGSMQDLVRKSAEECDNIYYHPAVPPKTLLSYSSSGDVGLLLYESTCLNNYLCSPNKFFEYAMAGIAIMVGNLAELRYLVEKHKCGLVVKENSVNELTRNIEKILTVGIAGFANNSSKLAKLYNWEEQEKVLLNVYKTLNPTLP